MIWFVLLLFIFFILTFLAYNFLLKNNGYDRSGKYFEEKELLLVIAHPDDETMFFLPLCLSPFKKKKIFCLSNGNYDKLGKIREKELEKVALKILRFDSVEIINNEFADGPNEKWDVNRIAELVSTRVNENTVLVTFDEFGVSNHANHIATHHGIKLYNKKFNHVDKIPVFCLITERNLFKKFSSLFGAAIEVVLKYRQNYQRDDNIIIVNTNLKIAYESMAGHESQFVWFRRLFIVFSEYTFLNKLYRLE